MITAHRKREISQKAWRVRERLGFTRSEMIDVGSLIERLKSNKDEFANFDVIPRLSSEMGSDEAWADTNAGLVYVRESVLTEALAGKPRPRFTIAHELGHLVLGHSGAPRRNPNKEIYQSASDRIFEAEADYFASSLLAPTQLAAGAGNAHEIEARFGLSSQAAEIAFERVLRESRIASGQTRRPPQAVIDFLQEARSRGYEVRSDIDFE